MTPGQRDRRARTVLACGIWLGVLVVVGVTADTVAAGLGHVDLAFLRDGPTNAGRDGGIGPIIGATLWVLVIGVLAAAPPALAAGITLAEYTDRDGLRLVRGALDLLAAVPSIVFGLFGLAFFCEALGFGWSVLAGGLTVALMILPLLVRLTEAGLRAVPDGYRSAGLALGLPRWLVVVRVLLPQAAPTLAAALMLTVGRVLAESAVFLYTSGASTRTIDTAFDPGRVLAVHVYLMATEVPGGTARASAAALVLLVAVLGSTLLAQAAPGWFFRRAAR